MRPVRVALAFAIFAAVAGAAGCGDRPAYWNTPVDGAVVNSYGLKNGVALVDDAAHRVVVVTAQSDLQLREQFVPIDHQVVSAMVSPDANELFVLSAGDWPRRTLSDQFPSLTVVDVTNAQAESRRFPMTEPRPKLAIDPAMQWAVAYSGASGTAGAPSFVENPNQIVIFDLAHPRSVTRTLQSFGGTPQRLAFTPRLQLPAGKSSRRLLLIETDIDLTMLDLDRAFDPSPPPEITVPLTVGTVARQVNAAGLAIDERHLSDPDGTRFAVWASNDNNVFALTLVAPTTDLRNDFAPKIELVDVGGIPTDVAFVEASGADPSSSVARRVAALVPSTSSAVLVDPSQGATTNVPLPAAYANFSLVTTNLAGAAPGTAPAGPDVALLWNAGSGAASGVALWSLGNSVMKPYRSIHVLGATVPIKNVMDVPPPNDARKVLQMSSDNGFYVLDLIGGKAPPLTTSGQASLTIAPDGLRLWAFTPGGRDLAAIDFLTLTPIPLTTDLSISAVYDVAAFDGSHAQGRALIALHPEGAWGATVFDAANPITATSRRVGSLLVEGP